MSPQLEQRICPHCGAIFYLAPGEELELPPHGCAGPPSDRHEQALPEQPEPAPSEQPQSTPSKPAESVDLFSSLQDQPARQPDPSAAQSSETPSPGELREETARSLRERGYVLTEDARGVRITGSPHGGSSGPALSPSDIVRIAAELEGGVKQTTTLQTCAKCQARTPAGEPKCQWCGEPFPPAEASG